MSRNTFSEKSKQFKESADPNSKLQREKMCKELIVW